MQGSNPNPKHKPYIPNQKREALSPSSLFGQRAAVSRRDRVREQLGLRYAAWLSLVAYLGTSPLIWVYV